MESQEEYRIELPEIKIDNEGDRNFLDIVLKIIRDTSKKGAHIYDVYGFNKGTLVGLQIEVSTLFEYGISKQGIINKNAFVDRGAIIHSVGKESDEFIKALSDLYGISNENYTLKKQIEATLFSQNQFSGTLNKRDEYKFKLFFGQDNKDLYAEIFLNIDTINGYVQLLEKDTSYRSKLINNLKA